ncbi:MAG: D-alanyl-D-alanine carboxypeptidase [Ruminococcaceae bacterium]|nr:D-alanyl-D-alanine carboxypeptidase [Oscillospiraceae bacterium]
MLKKVFSAFLIICLIFSPVLTVNAYEPSGLTITANAAMLVSLDTDEVLFEKNADQKVYPASITKIMTTLLILESEKYNPEAKIAMTEEALDLISGTGSSVSLLKAGEEITQLDLVYMVLMSSYGDCSLLAATYYGGSVDNFVNMMNTRANELGLTGTHYENPIGLHHEQNYTTARDTYVLTKFALQNDTFKEVCESTRHTVNASLSGKRVLSTTNFLQDNTTNYYYTYAKGVKTGYTDEAGRCLVSTASYNGYNYMCLVFGCPPNEKKHFTESSDLYRWAFKNFEFKKVADTSNPIAEIGVDLSLDTDYVSLYVEKGFTTVLPKDADDSTISIVPHPIDQRVDAPIKKGQVLGTADIIYAEQVIGSVNLIANENIEKSAMLTAIRAVKNFFTSSYMKVVYIIIAAGILVFILAIIKLNSKSSKKRKIKYVPYDENKKR